MRATIHKLLAGASLVVLTVFGLTVLSSSSSENSQVWAFLDTTCSSSFAELFDSIEDMLEQNGKERWGIVWDYKSYYRVAELNTPDPQCHLVSSVKAEPPIIKRATPLPEIKIPVGGSGGGGGGGGGKEPGPKTEPTVKFDDQDARELKNCLQNKLEALSKSKKKGEKLKKPSDAVDEKYLGCFVEIGLDNLEFKKTSFEWITDNKTPERVFGKTEHGKRRVTLNTNRISEKVKDLKVKNMQFDHLVTNVSIEELVHTMQDAPKPYEMYDLQVQANVFSFIWYKQLHNDKGPPLSKYWKEIINKHRDDDCNLTGKFLTQKQKYQNLEKQYADKNKTAKEKADIQRKMKKLEEWFQAELPDTKFHGPYDPGANLGCTDADKKEKK